VYSDTPEYDRHRYSLALVIPMYSNETSLSIFSSSGNGMESTLTIKTALKSKGTLINLVKKGVLKRIKIKPGIEKIN
jgi:hypothetical protein